MRSAPIAGRYLEDAVCVVCGERAGDDEINPGVVVIVLGEVAVCMLCVWRALQDGQAEKIAANGLQT